MSLIEKAAQDLLKRWTDSYNDSIKLVENGGGSIEQKLLWKKDLTETFLVDQLELELILVRHTLALTEDKAGLNAELVLANEELITPTQPPAAGPIFQRHAFELQALLSKL